MLLSVRPPSHATAGRKPYVPDRWVTFRIRDAYHPAPQWLLDRLHGNDVLQGRIVDVIRGWDDPGRHGAGIGGAGLQRKSHDYYALEVQHIPDLVLVPAWQVVEERRRDQR